jgi:nucleoside-diphosphate-sugar epimerase
MRLTIFGATGGTGRQLVQQALAAGHEVTAFVRNPSKLALQHDRLRLLQGDVVDAAAVERAVNGAQAVISTLNTSGSAQGIPITRGTQNILAAMGKYGVRRLVFSAPPSARDPQDTPDLRFKLMIGLVKLAAHAGYVDLVGAAQAVRDSAVDWTIVRLPFPPTIQGPAM